MDVFLKSVDEKYFEIWIDVEIHQRCKMVQKCEGSFADSLTETQLTRKLKIQRLETIVLSHVKGYRNVKIH